MKCGAPGSPEYCQGGLCVIEAIDHVKGLSGGGFSVVDNRIFLCTWHAELVVAEMARRGVRITAKELRS